MSADPFRAVKKRLHDMAQTWQPLMGLDDYDIQFQWWDRPWRDDGAGRIMEVTASWCYKWAAVQVNLPLANGRAQTELEGDLLREIGHILCAVLPSTTSEEGAPAKASLEQERLVTDLAQAIQRIAKAFYDKGRQEGRAECIRAHQPSDCQPADIGVQLRVS